MEWWKFGIMGKLSLFIPHYSNIPFGFQNASSLETLNPQMLKCRSQKTFYGFVNFRHFRSL